MPGTVTFIPQTRHMHSPLPTSSIAKRRVAAYARVSTDSDEQFTSYEAQIDYYTRFIQGHSEWSFIRVYTDEGVTGTSTKRREGFNRMVSDALAGKIDLIVTKSVSRFARNTVDSLTTVRKLKEHGVEVFFEKENIYTFDGKGELLITIMSSLAQEESRSISENVAWGQRKRFADGKVSMPYKQFLGYRKGKDGQPEIVQEEAAVVRLIYRLFLEGKTQTAICRYLEQEGIPSPAGKANWSQSTVTSILKNEKYKGDALLQKKFTVDFLTKKLKPNEGELPQFYVTNSHEAIIEKLEFDRAQAEFQRRKQLGTRYSGKSIFSSKLICADCGGYYGQKVWQSNTKYRKIIWQCNSKFKGDDTCQTPTLDEAEIKQMFLQAYNQLMGDRAALLEDCQAMRDMLYGNDKIEQEIKRITNELDTVAALVRACVQEHAEKAQSQEEFDAKYNPLLAKHERLSRRLDQAKAKQEALQVRDRKLGLFINSLKTAPLVLEEWDEQIWQLMLESAKVCRDHRICFKFKNGTEVTVEGA